MHSLPFSSDEAKVPLPKYLYHPSIHVHVATTIFIPRLFEEKGPCTHCVHVLHVFSQ